MTSIANPQVTGVSNVNAVTDASGAITGLVRPDGGVQQLPYVYTGPWAGRPLAGVTPGSKAWITDRTPGGYVWQSAAADWSGDSDPAWAAGRYTTILFGDSISQQQTTNIPTFTGFNDFGYVSQAIALAGGGWDVIRNAGISGNTTAQMLARVDADVIAFQPHSVDFMGGTNDLGDPAVVIPNWLGIFAKLRGAGIYVRHWAILPRPALTAAQQANILRCNQWAQNYWRQVGGGEFIDAFSAIVDPASTTQAGLAGVFRTDDGGSVHPSALGAWLIAQRAAPAFQRGAPSIMLPSSAMDDFAVNSGSLQHVRNPLLLGSGGTSSGGAWTGTIPANWTVSGPAGGTVTLVPRTDGFGNDLELSFTAAAAGEVYDIANIGTMLTGTLSAGSGRLFYAVGVGRVVSGGNRIRSLMMFCNSDGAFPEATSFGRPVVNSNLPATIPEFVVKTPVSALRNDVTFMGYRWRLITAAAGAIVVRIARCGVYEYVGP